MGFIERLKNSWDIFKFSLGLIKKDKSLIAIPILMFVSVIALIIIFILAFFTGSIKEPGVNTGIYFFVFVFFSYFITTFYASAQSWMIHEVVQGKNTTVASGFKRAFRNFFDILAFVFVFIIIRILASGLKKRGIAGKISAGFIETISGIVGKLVIPSMIITERHFGQAVMQLKDSYKAIPEIATFEIGIKPLISLTTIAGLFLAFIMFISFGIFIGIVSFILWVIVIMLFSVYINTTYYTLVYLTLIEKKKIKGLKLS